jgi:hypothetical protein
MSTSGLFIIRIHSSLFESIRGFIRGFIRGYWRLSAWIFMDMLQSKKQERGVFAVSYAGLSKSGYPGLVSLA